VKKEPMKTIKERILSIILITTFGLAFLGYILIRGALRHFDNYISYFMLVLGIGLIVLFGIVLMITIYHSKKKAVVDELEKFNRMRSWTKYKVNLDTVQIKSNSWDSSRFIENQIYDIEIQEKNVQTILEFELEINGTKKQFHWPSDRQHKSLEMYFAVQKETDFYLDPNDYSSFYLDLSFIPT
jgi:hypothetical protein